MELDEVPNLKGNQYPERISVSLSTPAKEKLNILKARGKDTAALVRKLIDDFLDGVDLENAS